MEEQQETRNKKSTKFEKIDNVEYLVKIDEIGVENSYIVLGSMANVPQLPNKFCFVLRILNLVPLEEESGTDNMLLCSCSFVAVLGYEELNKALLILINYLSLVHAVRGVKINILDKGCVDQVHLKYHCLQIN